MKSDYAWRSVAWKVMLCLVTAALLASCGGGGNSSGLDGIQQVSDAGINKGTGLQLITADEIGSLPAWQQELLNDEGWNQPPIPQRPDTPMPAPSYEMLLDWQANAMAEGIVTAPRAGEESKGSSYIDGAGDDDVADTVFIAKGEYPALYTGNPPYGCKDTGQVNGHSKEKKIAAEGLPSESSQVISFVLRGATANNHFNTTGGSTNNAYAAVYQLFSSHREAEPDPMPTYSASGPKFAEISYRADGGPAAGGVPCNAPEAYTVRDFIWWKYNQQNFNATPGLTQTALYNILIAPSSEISGTGVSAGPTTGRIQHFYMGNLSAVYGGAAIVTIESSTNACTDNFSSKIASNRLFYTNPIYGVLMQRWVDSAQLDSLPDKNPWKGDFGWPVQGPVAYNSGAQTLTGNGAYYAWGMYFERGFMWWIDYVNNGNVPDEAQAYSYTGSNVFCKGTSDVYEKMPTIYYGGSGALGVSVVVEASLNPNRGAGSPPAGTFYEVANPATGPALLLDMHAHGYGGTANAAGNYKFYTWAFRDGTLGVTNGTAYDNVTKYVTKAYTEQSVYTVRVQVVDAVNAVAYGDSLPIHVGQGGGANPNAQIWLIRMDTTTPYNTNHTAIKDSLTAVGASFSEVDFSASTAADFAASTAKVALFYRGGPGNGSEPTNTTAWTQTQYDAIRTILNSGTKRRVLLMSQSHATGNPMQSPYHYYQPFGYGAYPQYAPGFVAGGVAATADHTQLGVNIEGLGGWPMAAYTQSGSNYYQGVGYWYDNTFTVIGGMFFRSQSYVSQLPSLVFGTNSAGAAERYTGAGSSGKVPITLAVNAARQYTTRAYDPQYFNNNWVPAPENQRNPGFQAGMGLQLANWNTTMGNLQLVSYGNSTAPGPTAGSGKLWVIGYSWADVAPVGGTATKHDVLRNTLAWLDSTLTFSAKTNGGYAPYSGPPEIVSVTPAYWDETGHQYVTGAPTGTWGGSGTGKYPDQTSTNIYRSTVGTPANAILTANANNNWINGNDVDFQHPNYGYLNPGANTVLEVGAAGVATTDDSIFYAGLLASDADGSWARVTPADTPSIQLKEEQNNTMNRNPRPVVAGYYQLTGTGGTADDSYARYGTDPDSFTGGSVSWINDQPLQLECLARWPVSQKYFNWTGPGGLAPNAPDAYLVWQVYPGQGIQVPTGPNAGKFIGINTGWNDYLSVFDNQTSDGHTVAGRAGSAWNRPGFPTRDDPTQGRALSFNFRKIPDWNGDLNRDGAFTTADKFPARVRLFTNHKAYYDKVVSGPGVTGFPDHLADAGGDPATVPLASRNPSFIEGGAYVVDKGDPVYGLQVVDDTTAPNPGASGTITGQGPGTYTVRLQFEIKYGAPNYKIEADTWYVGGTFGPNNGVSPVLVKDFATAPNTPGKKDYTISIPAAQPNGNYTFAVRVTDQATPPVTATYVWPGQVGLFPQAILIEPFNNLNNWTTIVGPQNGWNNASATWGTTTSTSTAIGTLSSGQGGSGSFASPAPNTAYQDYYSKAIQLTNSITIPAGTAFSISFYTAGYSESFWDGLIAEVSFNGGTTWEGSLNQYLYWNNEYNSYIYGHYMMANYTYYPAYGFSSGSSAYGTGLSWVQHTRTYASSASARQFKMRFWFATDSSVNYNGGVCVDSLTVQ